MPVLSIQPMAAEYHSAAANLFVKNFCALRASVPSLSGDMEDPTAVMNRLPTLSGCLSALQDGELAGYLGWWLVDEFRGTTRKGGYVPEFAHAAAGADRQAVYRALYRAASEIWFDAGCNVHAITVLAHDADALDFWCWNGFGKTLVDAVRPAEPLNTRPAQGLILRKATPADIHLLAEIEAEHWRHYEQPPTLMTPHQPDDAAAFETFLSDPRNSAWLAVDGESAAAYLRFESGSNGAAAVVSGERAFACTGAYTRPAYRGKGAASSLLDAAIRDYASRGYTCSTVDYETINPTASVFWRRYYQPVCYSLIRVPEREPAK